MTPSSSTPDEIRQILFRVFQPLHLEIFDDSARHAGHSGAKKGGGHYRVILVSVSFQGQGLLERHRRVKEALKDFFGAKIHALQLSVFTPEEWSLKK